ncbi:MAG: flavodoxin-dependent (E)-4-hydroxy-3-methylbut-2-enyl-diphosphate synthase [Deltaproteobacteria bacterium]|nr:flavodoxin-dependent (E)-4-hydroxy-3-methylbut-2-enyl-diphosphate synthase [Deltaproteobacteria bacterium]
MTLSRTSSPSGRTLSDRKTRQFPVGTIQLGGDAPIAVQSMCATRTTDIEATLRQIQLLERAGAGLIRIAIDSRKDVDALREIRKETSANLVIDLQENYKLARDVAPYVQKFRYNPGHLHHHFRETPVAEKVKFLVETAGEYGCAIRIGVNFGSLDPKQKDTQASHLDAAVLSALEHCDMVESFGFQRYVVSLKSSDPANVVEINQRFAALRPEVPIHLGVTEAGLLPDAEVKTRLAFEKLLPQGIGDTLRVSLTLPDEEKDREVFIGRQILEDVANGRFLNVPPHFGSGLNVISCPSCSRVENKQFVRLAEEVKRVTSYAKEHRVTIAVMGCRVNGPGETDDADLGLWCAANHVNLKRKTEVLGSFPYDEVIPILLAELDKIIAAKSGEVKL